MVITHNPQNLRAVHCTIASRSYNKQLPHTILSTVWSFCLEATSTHWMLIWKYDCARRLWRQNSEMKYPCGKGLNKSVTTRTLRVATWVWSSYRKTTSLRVSTCLLCSYDVIIDFYQHQCQYHAFCHEWLHFGKCLQHVYLGCKGLQGFDFDARLAKYVYSSSLHIPSRRMLVEWIWWVLLGMFQLSYIQYGLAILTHQVRAYLLNTKVTFQYCHAIVEQDLSSLANRSPLDRLWRMQVLEYFFRTCFIFTISYKVHITETVVCDYNADSCFIEDFNCGRSCKL